MATRASRSCSVCCRLLIRDPTLAAVAATAVTPIDWPSGCHQPSSVVTARIAIPSSTSAIEPANHGSQRLTAAERATAYAPKKTGR